MPHARFVRSFSAPLRDHRCIEPGERMCGPTATGVPSIRPAQPPAPANRHAQQQRPVRPKIE